MKYCIEVHEVLSKNISYYLNHLVYNLLLIYGSNFLYPHDQSTNIKSPAPQQTLNHPRSTKVVQNKVESYLWKVVGGFVSSNKHLSHHLLKNKYATAHTYIITLFSICIV